VGHALGQAPVTIRLAPGGDPQTWHVLAVIDNAQHESLNPIEEARDYLSLQQQYSWTDRRVARTVGVSEARVKTRLRWLDLAGPIQELVAGASCPAMAGSPRRCWPSLIRKHASEWPVTTASGIRLSKPSSRPANA